VVCTLIVGHREGARGGDSLAEVVASLELPRGALSHTTDQTTLVVLWPAESAAAGEPAREFVMSLNSEAITRSGTARARVRAGIGGFHAGLRGVSRSYLEAQQAMEAGRRLRPEAIVHSHDRVIPYLVLAQNPLLADRFVRDSLGPLLDPETRNRAQLTETLEAYLSTGAVKDAATALDLHRHTVLYRLERVKELLGVDLDVPANRLRLQLALDLRRLL
jgi:DNA-binding PucR family transcriptional regulator